MHKFNMFDQQWCECLSYSRSIGVDVRYILWLVGKYDNAGELVEEMLR